MEEDLQLCKRERDEAEERATALQQKVFELEVDADTKVQSNDKARQIKLLEVHTKKTHVHTNQPSSDVKLYNQ